MDIKAMKVKDSSSLPKGRIVIDFDINKNKITVDGGGITEEEFSGIMLLILSDLVGISPDKLVDIMEEYHNKAVGDIDDFVDDLIGIMPGKDADKARLKEIMMDDRPASECEDELDELIRKMFR